MPRSFETDVTLLTISRSVIDESRRLLMILQSDRATLSKVDAGLLATSRSMIDESKRLLATLDEAFASATSGDEAHYELIEATTAAICTLSDTNRALLSVRIRQEGTRFGWTVYGPTKAMLGRGTAETELKARAGALYAGMTYVQRLKVRPAPDDMLLH
jgi:hypothetical protein